MLNLGMSELLVFAIIAVIVLGPEKLPTAMRAVIRWYRQVKALINNVQRDIERELEITEIREKMDAELKRIKEIEQHMQAQLDQIQHEVQHLEQNKTQTFQSADTPTTSSQIQTHTQPEPSTEAQTEQLQEITACATAKKVIPA